MERVHFQQEQMLPELKDLVEKGLFTPAETKRILRRRTQYETTLVRRVARKGDYLRYAAYEMQLEALRRKRAQRLQIKGPSTLSDYALVRRQFHIFERALKKFKDDVGLWVEYIRAAQREGARALVGRITARALQLHPRVPALYILAAQHELRHLAPTAARSLLQRGLRLNKSSAHLWAEYVRMELGFVESVRRRWSVLGITLDGARMDVEEEETESAAAQKAILDGAIVKEVVSSAAKELPTLELFSALARAIRTYPAAKNLTRALLEHLYEQLDAALPESADARRMHATRRLDAFADRPQRGFLADEEGEDADADADADALGTEAFVDALRAANEELRNAAVVAGAGSDTARAYASFVAEWCAGGIDANLKMYLVGSLGALAKGAEKGKGAELPHPLVLSTHLTLSTSLLRTPSSSPVSAEKVCSLARRYTRLRASSAGVWLGRLEAERARGAENEVRRVWEEAREAVGSRDGDEDVRGVWMWGFEALGIQDEDAFETALKRTLDAPDLHGALLVRYVLSAGGFEDAKKRVNAAGRTFRVSAEAWARIFEGLAERGGCMDEGAGDAGDGGRAGDDVGQAVEVGCALEAVYGHWQARDAVGAAVRWAGWLVGQGRGPEAVGVV
ncbi:U3 small nucleolar RNA-associated protein 6-domain-containing protein, partial [Vararia minispora EC-137]